jgi:hypothetical protein
MVRRGSVAELERLKEAKKRASGKIRKGWDGKGRKRKKKARSEVRRGGREANGRGRGRGQRD